MIKTIKHLSKNYLQRLDIHNSKVQFLDTLAILMGCKECISSSLPDGRRPDIIRIDTKSRLLFIGEGKNTETPGCLDTRARLLEYFRWISAHVSDRDRLAIFALCFEKEHDSERWIETTSLLSHEMDLLRLDYGKEHFEPGLNVVWFVFCDNN